MERVIYVDSKELRERLKAIPVLNVLLSRKWNLHIKDEEILNNEQVMNDLNEGRAIYISPHLTDQPEIVKDIIDGVYSNQDPQYLIDRLSILKLLNITPTDTDYNSIIIKEDSDKETLYTQLAELIGEDYKSNDAALMVLINNMTDDYLRLFLDDDIIERIKNFAYPESLLLNISDKDIQVYRPMADSDVFKMVDSSLLFDFNLNMFDIVEDQNISIPKNTNFFIDNYRRYLIYIGYNNENNKQLIIEPMDNRSNLTQIITHRLANISYSYLTVSNLGKYIILVAENSLRVNIFEIGSNILITHPVYDLPRVGFFGRLTEIFFETRPIFTAYDKYLIASYEKGIDIVNTDTWELKTRINTKFVYMLNISNDNRWLFSTYRIHTFGYKFKAQLMNLLTNKPLEMKNVTIGYGTTILFSSDNQYIFMNNEEDGIYRYTINTSNYELIFPGNFLWMQSISKNIYFVQYIGNENDRNISYSIHRYDNDSNQLRQSKLHNIQIHRFQVTKLVSPAYIKLQQKRII